MAVTILSMLQKLAGLQGRDSLDARTEPSQTIALQFLTQAEWLTAAMLCPIKLGNNLISAGNLDKLKLLLSSDEVTDTTTVTVEPNYIPFPDTTTEFPICYINAVELKIDVSANATYYVATECDYGSVITHLSTGNYPVTYSAPLFAFYASSQIATIPAGVTSVMAKYHYVKRPAVAAIGDNFPLEDDLMPTVMDYLYACSKARTDEPGDLELAQYFMGKYFKGIARTLGLSKQMPEKG